MYFIITKLLLLSQVYFWPKLEYRKFTCPLVVCGLLVSWEDVSGEILKG